MTRIADKPSDRKPPTPQRASTRPPAAIASVAPKLRDVAAPETTTGVPVGPHAATAARNMAPTQAPQGSFAFDGRAWFLGAFRSDGARALSPTLCVSDGSASAHADVLYRLGQRDVLIDPYVAAWRDQIWVGGSTGVYDSSLHTGARAGAQLTFSAGALTAPAGQVRQRPQRGQRRLPGFAPGRVYVQQEVHQQRTVGAAANLGLSLMQVMGLVRYDYVRQHGRHDTLVLDQDAACWLMQRHRGVLWPWLRDTVRALVKHPPLRLPDESRPAALRPGDHTRSVAVRQHSWFAALGAVWFFAGRYHSRVHELHLRAQQEGPHQRVTVMREQVSSRRWFGVVPGGLVADRGATQPHMQAWEYRFDLRNANERAACAALRKTALARQRSGDDRGLEAALSAAAGRAPVATESLQDARQSSHELGLLFGLFPMDCWRQWLPQGFGFGMLGQRFTNTRTHVRQGEDSDASTETHYSSGSTRLWGPRGEQQDDVLASVPQRTVPPSPNTPLLTLRTQFSRSRATASMFACDVIHPINRLFGTQLPLPRPGAAVASRHASVAWALTQADVQKLRASWCPKSPDAAANKPIKQPELAKAVPGVARRPLQALRTALRSDDPSVLAHALARFVQATGRPGMAALFHAVDGDLERLSLASSSDAYDRPALLADRCALLHPEAPHAAQGRRSLLRRFADVDAALLAMEQTRQQAQEDPLLTEAARKTITQRCHHAEARLRKLLHVETPADRREIARLMRAERWRPRQAQRVLEYYDDAPQRLAHDLRRSLGHAMSPRVGVHKSPAAPAPSTRPNSSPAALSPLHRSEKRRVEALLAKRARHLQRDLLLAPATRARRLGQVQHAWTAAMPDRPSRDAWNDVQRRALKRASLWQRFFNGGGAQRAALQHLGGKAARQARDLQHAVASADVMPARRTWLRRAEGLGLVGPAIEQAVREAHSRGAATAQRRRAAVHRENFLRLGPVDGASNLRSVRERLRALQGFLPPEAAILRLKQDLLSLPHAQRQQLRTSHQRAWHRDAALSEALHDGSSMVG